MHINRLSAFPQFVEPLARWHHNHWHSLLPWWRFEDALAELQDHASRDSLPTTLIALQDDQLIGSVSLIYEDLPAAERPSDVAALTPWMASLFVLPAWRGQGVGTALVRAAVRYASKAGETHLNLITMDSEGFYRGLGWSVSKYFHYREQPATLMHTPLGAHTARTHSCATGSSRSWCQSSAGLG
jgi:GNAT superfamily N-acetyltransferase